MRLRKLFSYGIFVLFVVIGVGFTEVVRGFDIPPTNGQIEFAQETSNLMLNTLFAALTQEFDETTVHNVEQGKQSISTIFNDKNKDMRLVGNLDPIRQNDRPSDNFERQANALALIGQTYASVQRVDGQWYYRRSVPLSNFRAECALCHANFPAIPSTSDWVGALMLRTLINN